MYGLYLTLIFLLLIIAVINLPYILFYLFYFSNDLFSTKKEVSTQGVKEAVKTNSSISLLLLPFKIVVLVTDLMLHFRLPVIIAIGLYLFYLVYRAYLDQFLLMLQFLNWNIVDIIFFVVGLGVIIFIIYLFIQKLHSHDYEEEKQDFNGLTNRG